ncbi:twin arginine-targeting protein translocase TatB [Candidatus Regiella insecticola 5.15]|uniref:Sec-independent protein translocase protein TatB n=1 Tax=Candidatus Regiella insecticola 5.15 TaxID=1005043 RepID=G2GZ26_9ENTR|nr:twin arginine-targeting protein translocase TatB [Candidatus Regiella insecticola 5.15]
MFDIGFGELLLVIVIGLIVLGPERLPVAVKTVTGWIRALRSVATTVQHEVSRELKLQELQDSLKKAEQAGLQHMTPELKASIDELKNATETLLHSYHTEVTANDDHTINHSLHINNEAIDDEAMHDEMISAKPPAAPKEVSTTTSAHPNKGDR